MLYLYVLFMLYVLYVKKGSVDKIFSIREVLSLKLVSRNLRILDSYHINILIALHNILIIIRNKYKYKQ